MKYFILSLFVCLYCFGHAQQVSGNATYQQTAIKNNVANAVLIDQAITLTVSGLLNAKADTYVAFFHVTQVGETAESTDRLMMERIWKFKTSLAKSGIDTIGVRTDMISFVPRYDFNVVNRLFSKTYNEVPDGFELQKNVIITYENSSNLDAIVTAAASAEIYDLAKVDYFLKDIKKFYDDLRLQCMTTIRDRIKSYEVAGIKLDTMKRTFADDFGTILPQHRYGQYQAVARPSLSAAKKSTEGTSLKFRSPEIPNSRYYQSVSFEEYDVVINPVVDEPMVQLTYEIAVKFYPAQKASNLNNYFLIGPTGQLQRLDVVNP